MKINQFISLVVVISIFLMITVVPKVYASTTVTFYGTTSDGFIYANTDDSFLYATYEELWNASDSSEIPYIDIDTVEYGTTMAYKLMGIGQSLWFDEFNKMQIFRAFPFFDTSDIPDDDDITITSVVLCLYGKAIYNSTSGFNVTVQSGQPTYPYEPMSHTNFYQGYYSGNGGELNTNTFTTTGYNNITLNSDGRSWINKYGITKLCLRSDRDIDAIEVTGEDEYLFVYTNENGPSTRPMLEVTYQYPPSMNDALVPFLPVVGLILGIAFVVLFFMVANYFLNPTQVGMPLEIIIVPLFSVIFVCVSLLIIGIFGL